MKKNLVARAVGLIDATYERVGNEDSAGDLGGGSDPLAEMMCQELLTKSGLRLDFDAMKVPKGSSWHGETYDPDELRKTIIALGQRVKQMAADFRRNARGKFIITATN